MRSRNRNRICPAPGLLDLPGHLGLGEDLQNLVRVRLQLLELLHYLHNNNKINKYRFKISKTLCSINHLIAHTDALLSTRVGGTSWSGQRLLCTSMAKSTMQVLESRSSFPFCRSVSLQYSFTWGYIVRVLVTNLVLKIFLRVPLISTLILCCALTTLHVYLD